MASRDKKQSDKRDESVKSEIVHRLKTHPFLFIGTVVVLVIVIVAFVFVPAMVPNYRYGGEELIFGYYNKVPIKYVPNNYFYQYQQNLTRQSQQPATDDPSYIYAVGQIWGQAYEATVIHMGILDEMKQAGYVVPESVVDREVAMLPHFQENGRFSSTKFRAMDNNSRMNLWRQVQESLSTEYYTSDLWSLRTAENEPSFISSMASPRRSFDLVFFPMSSYPDSEVESYAEANAGLFRITHLSKITNYSSEREAQQILDAVKNGILTFEEAARTSSQDEYSEIGGDLGIRMAYELIYEIGNEQIRESIINLPRGSVSDLVSLSSGWAFFRVEEATRQADISDQSQKDKIRNYIMGYNRGHMEDWLESEAKKFTALVKEIGFDEAAAGANLNKQSLGPIPVNYGDSALFGSLSASGISELAGASSNQFFWRQAFSTPLNSPSEPIFVGNNVVILFPLEESIADDSTTELIEAYYPNWVGYGMDQVFRSYFMNNEKLDDRFSETFWRLWGEY